MASPLKTHTVINIIGIVNQTCKSIYAKVVSGVININSIIVYKKVPNISLANKRNSS